MIINKCECVCRITIKHGVNKLIQYCIQQYKVQPDSHVSTPLLINKELIFIIQALILLKFLIKSFFVAKTGL